MHQRDEFSEGDPARSQGHTGSAISTTAPRSANSSVSRSSRLTKLRPIFSASAISCAEWYLPASSIRFHRCALARARISVSSGCEDQQRPRTRPGRAVRLCLWVPMLPGPPEGQAGQRRRGRMVCRDTGGGGRCLREGDGLAPPDAPDVTSMAGRTCPAMAGGTGVRSASCFAAAVAA